MLEFGDKHRRDAVDDGRPLGVDSFNIVADAGYSNGQQAAHCEGQACCPMFP